ncbi:MAG: type III-A CRISPR-associated RAMP protein Csm4 [Oliverpabstia sp.]|nr:type III-A CRISPR-associated RAMP protein Csm4 [Lachnospiraceae bacterium]MDY5025833.1 type III-A CRISPR-associated RAMP protein Csm4 [Oliverpabstia sp.]
MKYKIYRLKFPYGVHFGGNSLDESKVTFSADTLFSALYQEALARGINVAQKLYESVKESRLLFSDAFPYIGDTNYLPKPMIRIAKSEQEGDSVVKKAFKNLRYIPMDQMGTYMNGDLNPIEESLRLKILGMRTLKTSAAIHGCEETILYHIGVYYYNDGCGLYVIVGFESINEENMFYDLLDALSFSGIGGKRRSGFGRFEIESIEDVHLPKQGDNYMTLSVSLPEESEMDVLQNANYQVVKRGGFVSSENYSNEYRKKKDLFMISAGSCFQMTYHGDIYDISNGGKHAVYRYGKPIFWAL